MDKQIELKQSKSGNYYRVNMAYGINKKIYFVGITKDLTNTYKAGVLVKAMNEVLDGRGGGKPDFAQGGAPTLDKIDEAITALKSKL